MVESFEKTSTESLKLSNHRVKIEIDPQGAFLKSVVIDEKEVIYRPRNDEPGRGGIPILGPTPGPIKGSRWEGLYPNMPSHGTDRKTSWLISKTKEDEIILKRTIGPSEFLFVGEVAVRLALLKNGFSISKTITNFEEKPREIGHGFHPYFVTTKDTQYSPDEIKKLHPLTPGEAEIIKPGVSQIEMSIDEDLYTMLATPPPTQTVVWSDRPDLYECIEPWWAEEGKGDILKPNESKTYTLEIKKVNSIK